MPISNPRRSTTSAAHRRLTGTGGGVGVAVVSDKGPPVDSDRASWPPLGQTAQAGGGSGSGMGMGVGMARVGSVSASATPHQLPMSPPPPRRTALFSPTTHVCGPHLPTHPCSPTLPSVCATSKESTPVCTFFRPSCVQKTSLTNESEVSSPSDRRISASCAGGGAGCPKACCLLGLKARLFRSRPHPTQCVCDEATNTAIDRRAWCAAFTAAEVGEGATV